MIFKNAERVLDAYIRAAMSRGGDGFRRFSSKSGNTRQRQWLRRGRQACTVVDRLHDQAGLGDAMTKAAQREPKESVIEPVDALLGRLTNWQRHQLDRSKRDRRNEEVVRQFLALERPNRKGA